MLPILNPRSFIINLQTSILKPQSLIINPQFSILNPQYSILNTQSSYINPLTSILLHQSSYINPQYSILLHQSSFINPSFVKHEISAVLNHILVTTRNFFSNRLFESTIAVPYENKRYFAFYLSTNQLVPQK